MQQRLIRLKDAPAYLGMNKNTFNTLVRPRIPHIRISKQALAFDRLDLDRWVEDNKNRCMRSV